MQVGVWLQPRETPRTLVERAVKAEELGFEFVGVTDGQMIWRDVYVCLALAAQATSRVRLGPWVTNPITRHLTATANAICTLDEVSDGRAMLGIGVGDDSVHTIGEQPMRLDAFGEHVRLLRRLLRGETIDRGEGKTWHLSTGREHAPPVYWAAAGPRSLELAGELADGVVHSGWLVPELMREALDAVDRGEARSGREPGSTARIFNTAVAIHEDRDVALAWAAPYAARAYIYPASAQVPGWSEPQRQELLAEYDYYGHFSAAQRAAVAPHLVTNKVVAGTPDEAVALLQHAVDSGYTHAALIPMGDVDQVMDLLAREVMPRLRPAEAAA